MNNVVYADFSCTVNTSPVCEWSWVKATLRWVPVTETVTRRRGFGVRAVRAVRRRGKNVGV